jgi:hypothetical protein
MRWWISGVLLSSAAFSSSRAQTSPSPQSYVKAALVWLRRELICEKGRPEGGSECAKLCLIFVS